MSDKTRAAALAVTMALTVLVTACGSGKAPPPEAAPVIAVLKAIKASDRDGFRNAYSRRIREDADQGDWESNLAEARRNLLRKYGEYRIDEFEFSFSGDRTSGMVFVTREGTGAMVLGVVNEDDGWKLDQR